MRETSDPTEEASQRDRQTDRQTDRQRERERERERERGELNSDRENDGKDEDAEGFAMTGFVKDQRGWRGLMLLRSISGTSSSPSSCLIPK